MLPKTMTAICITRAGGPEVLQPAERPLPQPRMESSVHIGKILLEVAH
jgi:hypothetical protein